MGTSQIDSSFYLRRYATSMKMLYSIGRQKRQKDTSHRYGERRERIDRQILFEQAHLHCSLIVGRTNIPSVFVMVLVGRTEIFVGKRPKFKKKSPNGFRIILDIIYCAILRLFIVLYFFNASQHEKGIQTLNRSDVFASFSFMSVANGRGDLEPVQQLFSCFLDLYFYLCICTFTSQSIRC